MASLEQYSELTAQYVENVFKTISEGSGTINFKELFAKVGNGSNRVQLYRAIAFLTKEGRIKRLKGIGKEGIDYFYHDVAKIKNKKLLQPQ